MYDILHSSVPPAKDCAAWRAGILQLCGIPMDIQTGRIVPKHWKFLSSLYLVKQHGETDSYSAALREACCVGTKPVTEEAKEHFQKMIPYLNKELTFSLTRLPNRWETWNFHSVSSKRASAANKNCHQGGERTRRGREKKGKLIGPTKQTARLLTPFATSSSKDSLWIQAPLSLNTPWASTIIFFF